VFYYARRSACWQARSGCTQEGLQDTLDGRSFSRRALCAVRDARAVETPSRCAWFGPVSTRGRRCATT
jgi:hypothetical protein